MEREQPSEQQLEWERACSPTITSDVIWKLDAYRSSLFLLELARQDAFGPLGQEAHAAAAAQLLRAAGSVSANLGEGYSRATRADRLRFLGYALGSARECASWYLAIQDVLPRAALDARLLLLSRVRALLLGLIRATRAKESPHRAFEP